MLRVNVTRKGLGGSGNVACILPNELARIKKLYSTIDQDNGLELTVEAIGAELVENVQARDLLFSEGIPVSLEFEKYYRTDLFDRLCTMLGYEVGRNIGTFYGVTAVTPAERPASDTRCYTLFGDNKKASSSQSLPVTAEMIAGYRGMGIIIIPIPSDVIAARMSRVQSPDKENSRV